MKKKERRKTHTVLPTLITGTEVARFSWQGQLGRGGNAKTILVGKQNLRPTYSYCFEFTFSNNFQKVWYLVSLTYRENKFIPTTHAYSRKTDAVLIMN
jgi:hypothetical protein